MRNEISEEYRISPYFIIFPLYVSMVGVGVLTFQRTLIEHAGYNAWISVILTGISIHLILWMIYKITSFNRVGQEIITLNHTLFGSVFGHLLNAAVVLYFVYGAFVKFKVYIELIEVWFFTGMNILPLSIVMVLLIYYAVSGGFRSVTGLCVWATFLSFASIIPQVGLALPYMHPLNLLPLLNHSATDIFLSSKSMVFEFLGFETLLFFYPFIKTPAKSQKWAHMIVMFVTLLYLILLLMALMFFSEGELRHSIWPTIDMISIFEVPLLQRLEYFFISLWFIKTIAGICIYLWVACRGIKTAFRMRQRHSLIGILIAMVTLNYFIADHRSVERVSELYSTVGFYFIYAYIPFMFVCVLISRRRARHFGNRGSA
ncbi:GerAB/ArcD/ProY family transporter [Paenibacillus montanisoli]|uniref:Spore gernimation protein n=1 Tax=Paenibacillus montanisoli TaxID=2081970 RepID=A0A328TZ31_9BACL|nr:GerAB/ArcD/ProY family transporter [Paenibacillus montanisoli]RAP74773.1 spore gernimation protein [Paenibacillus montanisoli]